MAEAGKFLLPTNAMSTWRPDLVAALLSFPRGLQDDKADALGLIGRPMQKPRRGRAIAEPQKQVEYTCATTGRKALCPKLT